MADDSRPPLADELGRLLGALQDWTRQNLPAAPEGATTCEWCPLCQFVAVLRGERPELTERVAEAGAALTAVLHALVDATIGRSPAGHQPAGRSTLVEHIDLDEP